MEKLQIQTKANFKALRKEIWYLAQSEHSAENYLLAVLKSCAVYFTQPIEIKILVADPIHCWLYQISPSQGKQLYQPLYEGFYKHLKGLQSKEHLPSRDFRTHSELGDCFSPNPIPFTLGLPFPLLNGHKLWLLLALTKAPSLADLKSWNDLGSRISLHFSHLVHAALLRQHSVLQAQEQAVATLAHEIKGPLGNLLLSLKKVDLNPQQMQAQMNHCSTQAMRISEQMQAYLDFLRIGSFALESMDLSALLQEVQLFFTEHFWRESITFMSEDLEQKQSWVWGNQAMLFQVLHNLVENACKAIGKKGCIIVRLFSTPLEVKLEIQDSGPGVMAGMEEKIFQPFVTQFVMPSTLPHAKGTGDLRKSTSYGLGLSVCSKIVQHCGGRIYYSPAAHGKGFFVLSLLPSLPKQQ